MKKNNRRSIPAPPTNIYDQFLIVGLKEETLTPVVLYTYPSQNPAAPNVALFCFPEDICPETVNRIKTGASFFFVLTDEVGRQQVGFTRRIGRGKDMRCLCMLTHRDSSWMYTFGSILEECEGRYKAKGPNQLEPFLASLYSTPVPEPGMEIAKFGGANNNQSGYNFGNNYNTNNNTNNTNNNNNLLLHLYSRPIPCPDTTDTALVGVNMIPLLANLTTNSILQLFASLLFERRTILVSSQLERVSASAQASLSALFPFAWHHIFIPILPLSLVDYCSAPMPFVIGLHSSLMLSIIKMPLSEVVYVDLDRDQVSPVEGDMQLLPSALLTPLKSVLDAATSEFHNLQSSASKSNFDWQRVSDAFRQFFVRVFAGYGKFFVNKPGYGVSFDKEGFIASQNKNIRKFLEAFCASQMFERFIAEREAGKQNSIFENEIKLQEAAQAHVGIGSALQDKAKKSVERLTTFGAAVRNHLQENPFGGLRNTQDPSRPSTASSSSSLHPSLVRGQVVHASSNPPQRRAKPLPPIPPGATPSSAFPPHDISANVPPSGSPWDAFNDNTGTLNPVERPKSATVTSISPSSHNMPINPIPVPVSLPHSNSTNSIPHPSSSLPPNTNVFDFSPFDNMDTTPATPAPSISNTRAPDWFSPELVAGKLAAVSSNDSLNPFLTPSSPKLPPISMKPLNPFVENQIPHDAGHQNEEREGHNNLFTSFSLDALAPPDLANVHSPSLTTSYHGSGGYFEPTPTATYGSPSSNSGAYMPKQGGTMPNYNNSPAAGGTMPNYGHVVESTPNPPGGFAHGTSPQFESFLAARMIPVRSSSTNDVTGGAYHQQQILQQQLHHQQVQQQYLQHQHQQHQHHQQQQQQHPDEGDDFDSFLAARIKQM